MLRSMTGSRLGREGGACVRLLTWLLDWLLVWLLAWLLVWVLAWRLAWLLIWVLAWLLVWLLAWLLVWLLAWLWALLGAPFFLPCGTVQVDGSLSEVFVSDEAGWVGGRVFLGVTWFCFCDGLRPIFVCFFFQPSCAARLVGLKRKKNGSKQKL